MTHFHHHLRLGNLLHSIASQTVGTAGPWRVGKQSSAQDKRRQGISVRLNSGRGIESYLLVLMVCRGGGWTLEEFWRRANNVASSSTGEGKSWGQVWPELCEEEQDVFTWGEKSMHGARLEWRTMGWLELPNTETLFTCAGEEMAGHRLSTPPAQSHWGKDAFWTREIDFEFQGYTWCHLAEAGWGRLHPGRRYGQGRELSPSCSKEEVSVSRRNPSEKRPAGRKMAEW